MNDIGTLGRGRVRLWIYAWASGFTFDRFGHRTNAAFSFIVAIEDGEVSMKRENREQIVEIEKKWLFLMLKGPEVTYSAQGVDLRERKK